MAVVTRRGPDDPVMLSCVSQLIENGIFFEPGDGQGLLADLPPDLESYRAIVVDEPAFEAAMRDEASRRRLQAYAAGEGFVLRIKAPQGAGAPGDFNAMLMLDHLTFAQVHDLIMNAGLTRFHPAWRRLQAARPEAELLAQLKDRVIHAVTTLRYWHEFTLYYWYAARRLIEAGHADVRPLLIEAIRENGREVPQALTIDWMTGYWGAAWLRDATGEDGPLQRVIANVEEVMARRPRSMGVLTGSGFADDPFGQNLRAAPHRLEQYYDAAWSSGREIIWTEIMLAHGPTFGALARVTGDARYRDEALRLVEHLARYHQREDGLLWHCTRRGQPAGRLWSRGMTHALFGLMMLMEELGPRDAARERIIDVIRRAGRGLKRWQDEATGLWRNVVDCPAARLETSGTTLFAQIYARGIREGWLDRAEFEDMVRRAWAGVKTCIWRGRVAAWCRGTAGAVDDAYYLARPQGGSSSATPPHLLATLLEMQRLG